MLPRGWKVVGLLKGEATMKTVRTGESSIRATVRIGEDEITIDLNEDGIFISGCSVAWCFANNTLSDVTFGENDISLVYNGFERKIGVHGVISAEACAINPKDGYLSLTLKR